MQAKTLASVNLILLLIWLLATDTPFHGPAAQTQAAGSLKSPRLVQLQNEVKAGKPNAVELFWQDVATKETPLVETIPGDNDNLFVTFLWRENKDTQVILSTDFAKSVQEMQLLRLLDTDVWYKTYRMRNDAHFFYQFAVNDPNFPFVGDGPTKYPTKFQADPLNRRQYSRFKPNVFSVVELPKAKKSAWTTREPDTPKGEVGQIKEPFKSKILNNERKIFIYRPPGFTRDGPRYPLLVMGSTYVSTIPLPIILDNMIAKGLIPPVAVLFVDYPDGETQNRELSCDAKYGEFLAKELIPAQRDFLHATADPKLITTGGASMSGLSAACLAFQHPDVFGNVISQSGSFWWSPPNELEDQWLTREYAKKAKLPVRFFMSIGLLESEHAFRGGLPSMLHANRHFRDVLQAKDYTVVYHEINGGHDPLNWQTTLSDLLLALFAEPRVRTTVLEFHR
jgi:enterochelin esterase-like enzyme